ncbi:hypothetical protein PR003_g16147 [Phytophthora rubi]|uniref:Uncharacterized protein n=1 Tax=Phytophthora rubi TaxID=129364 RepID=A0A6A4EIX7_9STRA|nr:hypothetical protein PR002_g15825 [Phytophthora rubi]KAE9326884.1 hypothetical protein PR003_g16147 [Phytophthora rubi]
MDGGVQTATATLLTTNANPVLAAPLTGPVQVVAPTPDALPTPDGYRTATRKGGKGRLEPNGPAAPTSSSVGGSTASVGKTTETARSTAKPTAGGGQSKQPCKENKGGTPRQAGNNRGGQYVCPRAYNLFKKKLAQGRYAALADSDPEDFESDSEEEKAEAPYAYTDAPNLAGPGIPKLHMVVTVAKIKYTVVLPYGCW